jgi:hypothetical protein
LASTGTFMASIILSRPLLTFRGPHKHSYGITTISMIPVALSQPLPDQHFQGIYMCFLGYLRALSLPLQALFLALR